MIEYGRYCTPKIDSISHKYPNFHPLSANDMILFLFNNVDSFVCKKLGHFIFLAFEKRQSRSLNIATNTVSIFRVILAIIIIIIIHNNKCYFLFFLFFLYLDTINIVIGNAIYSWKCQ